MDTGEQRYISRFTRRNVFQQRTILLIEAEWRMYASAI